jgi:hypothetical protein
MNGFWSRPAAKAPKGHVQLGHIYLGEFVPNTALDFFERCEELKINIPTLPQIPKATRESFYAGTSVMLVTSGATPRWLFINLREFFNPTPKPPEGKSPEK